MSVCLVTGVLVFKKHSSEFSRMWGWDPLINTQSHEMQTGQQQPPATHSNNLQPATCTFAVLLLPQMPFKNVPQPKKMRQCNGKVHHVRQQGSSFSSTMGSLSELEEAFHKDHLLKQFPDAHSYTMAESLGKSFQNIDS